MSPRKPVTERAWFQWGFILLGTVVASVFAYALIFWPWFR